MAKLRRVQPWWLETGTEICPGCHQLYLYELEYRCADCDGNVCAACVLETQSLTVVCPTCSEGSDSEAEVLY